MSIADTPEPPYYTVIFTSEMSGDDPEGYAAMAEAMDKLAATQPGYLGIETVRSPDGGMGITVSYWESEDAIRAWKANAEHMAAQKLGRERWYADYSLRIAKVERAYKKDRGK